MDFPCFIVPFDKLPIKDRLFSNPTTEDVNSWAEEWGTKQQIYYSQNFIH